MKVLPKLTNSRDLKAIDPKYFGETLDLQRRPLEELDPLREQWKKEFDENFLNAPNFYDWIGTIKASANVLQFNEEERVPYVVTVKNNQLHGELIKMKSSEYAFVLDPTGTFYASPKQTSGEMRIHHSSFLSGAPVQCAGVFFLGGGGDRCRQIIYIKDYSGHYQPGIHELLRLEKRLCDLDEGNVKLRYYEAKVQPQYEGPFSGFREWLAKNRADKMRELGMILPAFVALPDVALPAAAASASASGSPSASTSAGNK